MSQQDETERLDTSAAAAEASAGAAAYSAMSAEVARYYRAVPFYGEYLPYAPLDVEAAVYVELAEREFSRDSNTMSLEDFIAELRTIAAKAPKKAEVLIEFCPYGEDEYVGRLGYFRAPTKKERADREETNRKIAERDKRVAKQAEDEERAEFERLKAKFE